MRGQNLEDFPRVIKQYEVVVTYNGNRFDIPIIEADLDIRLDLVHIDLCPLLHHLGFAGGLKGCEKKLGLSRGELDGVDGAWAVILWLGLQHRRRGQSGSTADRDLQPQPGPDPFSRPTEDPSPQPAGDTLPGRTEALAPVEKSIYLVGDWV